MWIYAFGQAFFSLSVAGNGSVIYGSYLSDKEDIPSAAGKVALFDTIAALLAMMVIVPAIGASGMSFSDVNPGPGLMFVYLVNIMNGMPGGLAVGIIFYIAVLFAGLSSIVNLYEVPVATLQDQLRISRVKSVVIIGALGAVISLLIQPYTSQWMDLVSIFICPLGALLAAVLFFWVAGKEFSLRAVNQGAKKQIGSWFYPLTKYVYCALCVVALVAGALLGGIG